jgi:hypothetical protein
MYRRERRAGDTNLRDSWIAAASVAGGVIATTGAPAEHPAPWPFRERQGPTWIHLSLSVMVWCPSPPLAVHCAQLRRVASLSIGCHTANQHMGTLVRAKTPKSLAGICVEAVNAHMAATGAALIHEERIGRDMLSKILLVTTGPLSCSTEFSIAGRRWFRPSGVRDSPRKRPFAHRRHHDDARVSRSTAITGRVPHKLAADGPPAFAGASWQPRASTRGGWRDPAVRRTSLESRGDAAADEPLLVDTPAVALSSLTSPGRGCPAPCCTSCRPTSVTPSISRISRHGSSSAAC